MSHKKIALLTVLSVASIALGAVLGLLDIFGFIDGRHTLSLTLLVLAVIFTYSALITVFVLNFARKNRVYTFFAASSGFFGITFFLVNLNILLALLAAFLYFAFLYYVYTASVKRSELFVIFSPKEIFFPILRKSFTFFLILLSVLTYTQSQKLISENNLVSPDLIRFISRPTVLLLNQQINSQLQSGISPDIMQSLSSEQKQQIIVTALEKTVDSMANKETGDIYGFTPNEIPIELAEVSESGAVDISPVIEGMIPSIAYKMNERIQQFALLAPFVVALLTFLLLQPLVIPLQLIESLITLVIFKLLIHFKFIIIKTETKSVEVLSL